MSQSTAVQKLEQFYAKFYLDEFSNLTISDIMNNDTGSSKLKELVQAKLASCPELYADLSVSVSFAVADLLNGVGEIQHNFRKIVAFQVQKTLEEADAIQLRLPNVE